MNKPTETRENLDTWFPSLTLVQSGTLNYLGLCSEPLNKGVPPGPVMHLRWVLRFVNEALPMQDPRGAVKMQPIQALIPLVAAENEILIPSMYVTWNSILYVADLGEKQRKFLLEGYLGALDPSRLVSVSGPLQGIPV